MGKPGFNPWAGKTPWRRKCQPTPVFLPGESHGRRTFVGYSPQGHNESDTTERLHFHVQGEDLHHDAVVMCLESYLILSPIPTF